MGVRVVPLTKMEAGVLFLIKVKVRINEVLTVGKEEPQRRILASTYDRIRKLDSARMCRGTFWSSFHASPSSPHSPSVQWQVGATSRRSRTACRDAVRS